MHYKFQPLNLHPKPLTPNPNPYSTTYHTAGTAADREFIEDFLFKDPVQKTHGLVPFRPGNAGSGYDNNTAKAGPTTPPRVRPRLPG